MVAARGAGFGILMSDDDSLRGVDGDSMRNHEVMSWNSLLAYISRYKSL